MTDWKIQFCVTKDLSILYEMSACAHPIPPVGVNVIVRNHEYEVLRVIYDYDCEVASVFVKEV